MRRLACAVLLGAAAVAATPCAAQSPVYIPIPGGTLSSVLARNADIGPSRIAAFEMRETPVTVSDWQSFVTGHPEWQRGRVARAFADEGYLKDWRTEVDPPPGARASQPITAVSWFAAQAYCETEGARLPTWPEWEYVAAADAGRRDARADPAWRSRILAWYGRPAAHALPDVGGQPNVYRVRDLHGLVWEWVDDFNALLINPDSRSAEDPDKLQFCGAGAIDLQDRENYAVLMRVALLSSLEAAQSTSSLGLRCVRPLPPILPHPLKETP
ncbi:formylglycine-generating enzyme family protein [Rhizobacter sp. P5_C2]